MPALPGVPSISNVPGPARVGGIRPSIVRNGRCPTRSERVLIIRVRTKTLVKLGVLGELVAVELHTEPRTQRHRNGAFLVFEPASLDDVIGEMMIVGVGSKCEVRDH